MGRTKKPDVPAPVTLSPILRAALARNPFMALQSEPEEQQEDLPELPAQQSKCAADCTSYGALFETRVLLAAERVRSRADRAYKVQGAFGSAALEMALRRIVVRVAGYDDYTRRIRVHGGMSTRLSGGVGKITPVKLEPNVRTELYGVMRALWLKQSSALRYLIRLGLIVYEELSRVAAIESEAVV